MCISVLAHYGTPKSSLVVLASNLFLFSKRRQCIVAGVDNATTCDARILETLTQLSLLVGHDFRTLEKGLIQSVLLRKVVKEGIRLHPVAVDRSNRRVERDFTTDLISSHIF